MKILGIAKLEHNYDTIVLPMTENLEIIVDINDEIKIFVNSIIKKGLFSGKSQEVFCTNIILNDEVKNIILVGIGNKKESNRLVFIDFALAFSNFERLNTIDAVVMIDNVDKFIYDYDVIEKICEASILTDYNFDYYKSEYKKGNDKTTVFVSTHPQLSQMIDEASCVAEATLLARDLCNHPAMYMTPNQIANKACEVGDNCNIKVEIYNKNKIEELHMGSFLAVGKGSKNDPVLIVMKYENNCADSERIALVGKGVMYDSGGFSLKSANSMTTMYDDMGGAAAVIGAMQAIAKMKLKVNVIGIIAACDNILSKDALLPGDVITSMSGKTVQVLNTDAEGRLTLIDAITYAIRNENASKIIDIATLTGSAKGAVGYRSAALISNDDVLYETVNEASKKSCEKVWRLPADEELRFILNSNVADIKNCSPGNNVGGGSIVAALFIEDFVEEKPWVHLDIAPTGWSKEGLPYSKSGATGYGTSLLYNTIKLISSNY